MRTPKDSNTITPLSLKSHAEYSPGAENHISKSALAKHVKEVHDQIRERKHFCDQCPKAFTQKHSLVVHQRSHTGEKPYTCDICFKKFISAINHKVHQRIHRGEKPFLCDICSKTFRTTTHLKRHKARHTGEKPYPSLFVTTAQNTLLTNMF